MNVINLIAEGFGVRRLNGAFRSLVSLVRLFPVRPLDSRQRLSALLRLRFGLSAGAWAGMLCALWATNTSAAVRYVDVNSASPAAPYTNWATAAATIQDAVDAAVAGDEIVVTNGVYQTGGRAVGTNSLLNRVAVDKPLTVRSVNGPAVTVIRGYQVPGTTNGDGAVRCVYLTNGAVLTGFTLTSGATRTNGDDFVEQSGGGLWCDSTNAVVADCVLSGNSAEYGGVERMEPH